MMKEMFRDDQMKDMMNQAFPTLPKKAVGENDTWESEADFKLPLVGGFTLKTTSTLKEIRKGGKEAVIKMDTKIERKDSDEEEDPFGGMLDLGDTTFKSTVIWLVDKGIMKSAKGTMTMELDLGGQEVLLEITQGMKLAPRDDKKDVPSKDKRKKRTEY